MPMLSLMMADDDARRQKISALLQQHFRKAMPYQLAASARAMRLSRLDDSAASCLVIRPIGLAPPAKEQECRAEYRAFRYFYHAADAGSAAARAYHY